MHNCVPVELVAGECELNRMGCRGTFQEPDHVDSEQAESLGGRTRMATALGASSHFLLNSSGRDTSSWKVTSGASLGTSLRTTKQPRRRYSTACN
jgi:hypothetical protein